MTDYDEAMQLIECGKQVERSHTTSTPSLLGITQLHGNPKQTLFREGWVGSPEEGKKIEVQSAQAWVEKPGS